MPNFKKPRGGFAKGFMKKSPMKAADTGLMQMVGDAGAKSGHMGKVIEAMGKSERSSQIIDNVQKLVGPALGLDAKGIAGKIKGLFGKKEE